MNRKVLFLMMASACLLSGCGDKSGTGFTHSVLLTQPSPAGEGSHKALSGFIQEANEISLGFKTAGQLMKIFVEEGDYVREGQLIATLDDVDYKLGVEAARIQYEQQRDENKRLTILHEKKGVSDNDYEKAIAGEEQLRVQLQTYQNKLDYTKLYAPLAGYVQSVNFSKAEMVDAGTAVITLLDVHRMEVEVSLPLSLYKQREQFGEIYCTLTSDRSKRYLMRTISISPKADAMQLHKMQLAFTDEMPGMNLTSGMNVEVDIRINSEGNAGNYTLPMSSIFQENGKTYVWTVDSNSTVGKKEVDIQGIDGSGAAIVSGLNGTERVVKAGVSQIKENEKVNVLEKESDTNVGGLV